MSKQNKILEGSFIVFFNPQDSLDTLTRISQESLFNCVEICPKLRLMILHGKKVRSCWDFGHEI